MVSVKEENTPVPMMWVRTPHQDRSRKTLERILDATETLLEERGFDSVSVAEIAQLAGSSVGAIYARFRDKNGMLHILHERFCEEAIATSDASLDPLRWQGSSAREIVTSLITFLVGVYSERAGLLRAFLFHGCSDPDFLERDQKIGENFISRLKILLLARSDEISHPNPQLAVAFGMGIILNALQCKFVLGEGLPVENALPHDALVIELSRAYGGYLGLQTDTEIPSGQETMKPK